MVSQKTPFHHRMASLVTIAKHIATIRESLITRPRGGEAIDPQRVSIIVEPFPVPPELSDRVLMVRALDIVLSIKFDPVVVQDERGTVTNSHIHMSLEWYEIVFFPADTAPSFMSILKEVEDITSCTGTISRDHTITWSDPSIQSQPVEMAFRCIESQFLECMRVIGERHKPQPVRGD